MQTFKDRVTLWKQHILNIMEEDQRALTLCTVAISWTSRRHISRHSKIHDWCTESSSASFSDYLVNEATHS